MTKKDVSHVSLVVFIIVIFLFPVSVAGTAGMQESSPVLIGVLANRGEAIALQEWGPTAEYLSRELTPVSFEIVPLPFHLVNNAVENHEISFIVVNPSVYTNLEYNGTTKRVATLQVPGDPDPEPLFGGVIFTRSDRNDITNISDLRGKRFVAVDQSSLGGWQAAWKEILSAGLNPESDFSSLIFTGTHDDSVYAVINGSADAGTVRSTQIERMEKEGLIDTSQIKVLNDQHEEYPHYPYRISTSLYPEWLFAAIQGTNQTLCKQVSIALLEMNEDDPAALAVRGAGWAITQDLTPVHELLRSLHLPPYDKSEDQQG
jgi:two-component system sensor histidine kinase TtrS